MHNELADPTFITTQHEGPRQSIVDSPVTVSYMPMRVTDMKVNTCY